MLPSLTEWPAKEAIFFVHYRRTKNILFFAGYGQFDSAAEKQIGTNPGKNSKLRFRSTNIKLQVAPIQR